MSTPIKIALISFTASDNKDENIIEATRWISRAKATFDPDWICLPEMWAYKGPGQNLGEVAEKDEGAIWLTMSEIAANMEVVLFAGSWPERSTDKAKFFNTSYVFDRKGKQLGKYRKIHLFDLNDSDGKSVISETASYKPGSELVRIKVDGYQVGLSTCYDLRFPAFYEKLCAQGKLDILSIPSAFTYKTGAAHWEVLLRARAIEQQCYVMAPNQTGTHRDKQTSYGHAMIVDPWGAVLANTGEEPGIAIAQINNESIERARSQIPALKNRKTYK